MGRHGVGGGRNHHLTAPRHFRALGLLLAVALTLIGCGHGTASPRLFMYYPAGAISTDLETLLVTHPIPATANIHAVEIGRTASVSHHLVQVRDREPLHVHRRHDLTVIVVEGAGEMTVGGNVVEVRSGDAVFVPAGVSHFFRNGGGAPAVALVTFSPPFDSTDTVPVER